MRFIVSFLLVFFSSSVFASEPFSRRDGFLLIWEAIDRPAEETREIPFVDVPEGDRGSLEITYAKRRGLLDDEEFFRPDEALTTGDALIWLLRTRNVSVPDEITLHLLPDWLKQYPVASIDDVQRTMTGEELTTRMQELDQLLRDEVHEVSLYAEKFHGKGTAFGETFDMFALTAAHRTFPHNTLVKVTNIDNDRSVIVRINDRGPFVEGRDMDLSLAAFTTIAERGKGVIRARFERLGTGSATDDPSEYFDLTLPPCSVSDSFFRRIGGGAALHRGIPNIHPINESLRLSASHTFVVRSVIGPDGTTVAGQDFVFPGEVFSFLPTMEGAHTIAIGSVFGRVRRITVIVENCMP